MRDVARRHRLAPHFRFGHEIQAARFNQERTLWEIETTQGELTADILVSATGALADPVIPDLPGLEHFRGRVFHSARWEHDHNLEGRRVAVVGTGASAIQFVPEIQPRVGSLSLFQRTPPWVMPVRTPGSPSAGGPASPAIQSCSGCCAPESSRCSSRFISASSIPR